jgi:hypothetical protein
MQDGIETSTRPVFGPRAKAAARLAIRKDTHRKVLVLIAAWIDAGRDDPSIRELTEAAKSERDPVVYAVEALERDGRPGHHPQPVAPQPVRAH